MSRNLQGRSLFRILAPAIVSLAGCAATHTPRDVITRRNPINSTNIARLSERVDVQRSPSSRPVTEAAPPIAQTSATVTESQSDAGSVDLAVAKLSESASTAESSSGIAESEPSAAYTLSLGGILQLADAQNPNVALAQERITEAYARLDRAEALWLPSLRAGVNYNHHEGAIQDVAGKVFQTNRSAFGGGLGSPMYGAASPNMPGLVAQFHLSDAIFQPRIAGHQASSRQFGAAASRNDVLRDASIAYLELVRAEHGVAIATQALEHTEKLATLTRQYSESGQGLRSDYQRMEAELAIRQDQLAIQREGIQIASARLAQLLHADPSVLITTGEPAVTPLDIMSVDDSAASYVALGLTRRPELSEQKHLICEAVERINREKFAPLIPSVLLGMSYGGMGGGLGNSITNSSQRWDADAIAYWEVRNLGFGDRAARDESESVARQAQMRSVAMLDRVAREVVEAHTQVVQRKKRLDVGRKGIAAAEQSYELNLQRIENSQGLPIEVLQAIQALANARRAYLNAVVDYNIAQFELSRATGWFVESESVVTPSKSL